MGNSRGKRIPMPKVFEKNNVQCWFVLTGTC